MWPDSPFARPVSSFEAPVSLVLVDPCDNPDLTVSFRSEWLPYILGSLKQLVLQSTWKTSNQDDLWLVQERAMSLLNCFMQAAPVVTKTPGLQEDDNMPIRIDCDCNVWVTCCDGTEVQLATVGMVNRPRQPGGGTPQPAPGGGTQTYGGCLNGNETWLLPVPLSTGDVVSLSDFSGAWSDGTLYGWSCPDGSVYFAGACVGGGTTDPGDPLPTAKHMAVVMFLDGDYYDLTLGPVTIPAGVDTIQGFFQANDADTTDNSGQICFSVEVTNNKSSGPFSHYFDFKSGPFWESYARSEHGGDCTGGATWVGSQGWKDIPCVPQTANYLDTEIVFAPTDLTSISVVYDNNNDFDASSDIHLYVVIGGIETEIASFVAPPSGIATMSSSDGWSAVTAIRFRASIDGLDNHTVQLSATVNGTGADPF